MVKDNSTNNLFFFFLLFSLFSLSQMNKRQRTGDESYRPIASGGQDQLGEQPAFAAACAYPSLTPPCTEFSECGLTNYPLTNEMCECEARKFWANSFGVAAVSVEWEQFCRQLQTLVPGGRDLDDLAVVLIDWEKGRLVPSERWLMFVVCFSAGGILHGKPAFSIAIDWDAAFDLASKPWFFGVLGTNDANAKLEPMSFMVRMSGSAWQQGCFTVSLRDSRRYYHYRVARHRAMDEKFLYPTEKCEKMVAEYRDFRTCNVVFNDEKGEGIAQLVSRTFFYLITENSPAEIRTFRTLDSLVATMLKDYKPSSRESGYIDDPFDPSNFL